MRRLCMPAIGAAIAIFAVAAPAAHAGAATASACTTKSGVRVMVDFTHFQGNIERGCAPGHPDTALAALRAAGFQTAGTDEYGDAFVCRIDDLPSPKVEACAVTPAAKSSWSFYWAHPTDSAWTYSNTGVTSYQPAAGTLLAFAFGNYATPGIRPSAVVVAAPTTTTAAPPSTSAPVTPQGVRPSTTAPAVNLVAPATAASRPGPSAPTTTIPTLPTPSTSIAGRVSTSAPRVIDRTATGPVARTSSGSPLPAGLTAALVLVLGIGAGLAIRARRRRAA